MEIYVKFLVEPIKSIKTLLEKLIRERSVKHDESQMSSNTKESIHNGKFNIYFKLR